MAMDAALKAKWIEALRSGKYQQGKSYLCINNKYCCLGVLSEVANVPKQPDFGGGVTRYKFDDHLVSASFVYGSIKEQLQGHGDILVNMNDCKNASFNEIADYIAENL